MIMNYIPLIFATVVMLAVFAFRCGSQQRMICIQVAGLLMGRA